MTSFHQADQFALQFNLTSGGEPITPDNVTGVRIVVGHVIHEYPKGSLTYDGKRWLFPLLASQSALMGKDTKCQVEIKVGDDRIHSDEFFVDVKDSKLKGGWNGN